MNTHVYKYELRESVEMPRDAEILYVGYQKILMKFYIWALVDRDEEHPTEMRNFQLLNTGERLKNDNLLVKPTYIGSTMAFDGGFVLHVFENKKLKV